MFLVQFEGASTSHLELFTNGAHDGWVRWPKAETKFAETAILNIRSEMWNIADSGGTKKWCSGGIQHRRIEDSTGKCVQGFKFVYFCLITLRISLAWSIHQAFSTQFLVRFLTLLASLRRQASPIPEKSFRAIFTETQVSCSKLLRRCNVQIFPNVVEMECI